MAVGSWFVGRIATYIHIYIYIYIQTGGLIDFTSVGLAQARPKYYVHVLVNMYVHVVFSIPIIILHGTVYM